VCLDRIWLLAANCLAEEHEETYQKKRQYGCDGDDQRVFWTGPLFWFNGAINRLDDGCILGFVGARPLQLSSEKVIEALLVPLLAGTPQILEIGLGDRPRGHLQVAFTGSGAAAVHLRKLCGLSLQLSQFALVRFTSGLFLVA
jgi:hypothetical protein